MGVQEPPLHGPYITLSVGDQPGCSGMQLITERDPALTLDEQIMKEYIRIINQEGERVLGPAGNNQDISSISAVQTLMQPCNSSSIADRRVLESSTLLIGIPVDGSST